MVEKRDIIIIILSIGLTLVFIFLILPQINSILIFFHTEFWVRVLTLSIIIPIYFTIVLWLIVKEVKIRFKVKNKIEKMGEINKEGDKEKVDVKEKKSTKIQKEDLDLKVRLIYNSIKNILKESNSFSVKELSDMLEIGYKETQQIIENFISENIFDGYIEKGIFYIKEDKGREI